MSAGVVVPIFLGMTTWTQWIDAWAASMRAAGKSMETIKLRRYQVARAGDAIGGMPDATTLEQLEAWLAGQEWGKSTLRSYRAALRTFYAWGVATGRVDSSPAHLLPSPGLTAPAPHPAPDDALEVALRAADDDGRLMIRLSVEHGLRRGEVCRVHSRDLIRDLTGWSLIVHGKGGKTRVVPLQDGVAQLLRSRPPGWVFPGAIDGHLSAKWVGTKISRLLPDGWRMHSFRHRFATRAYAQTSDLLAVQQLLGHASPVTTQMYVKMPDDRLRAVMLAAA